MKRYYFYTPSSYKNEYRKMGVIEFRLEALYCEDAYSDKVNRQVKSFSYFDNIRSRVSTKSGGLYSFRFETGKDLASGHYAKSEKELLEAYKGSVRICERDYLRLRKVAVGLLFKYTHAFQALASEESKYLWCNESYSSFYDLRLVALDYNYNTKQMDSKMLDWFREKAIPLHDCSVPEEIRIHISKPSRRTKERNFKCSTFEITGNGANCRYIDIPDALKSLQSRSTNYEEVNYLQFERLRKICKALMFDYTELEFSELKKPQTHSIRILDI